MNLSVIPLRNRIQDAALECAKVKKPNPLLEEIRFEIVQGGTCAQILHIGAYNDELVSFAMLDKICTRPQSDTCGKLPQGNLSEYPPTAQKKASSKPFCVDLVK